MVNQPTRSTRYSFSRFATVKRVDYENWVADISWDQGNSAVPEVSIGMAFTTPRAALGGMPEPGSSVLTDFTASGTPVVSSYLPSGYRAGIMLRKQLNERRDLKNVGMETTQFRRKFRKLYPGEIIGSSTQGSDLLLDENTFLTDMKGDELRIDSRDQSINQISINNYRISDAARKSEGWVYRYIEEAYTEAGEVIGSEDDPFAGILYEPDLRQPYIYDESLKKRWYRTIRGDKTVDDYLLSRNTGSPDLNSAPLVEVRSEIREVGSAHLPMTDHNVEKDIWGLDKYDEVNEDEQSKGAEAKRLLRGNIIESVSGTLVGYDPFNYYATYGKVLKPQIFRTPDTAGFEIDEIPVEEGQEPDFSEVRYFSAAYMWKMPYEYSQTRLYVSKEGHTFLHVGSTYDREDCPYDPKIEHPLGAGRSVEANFGGSIKAVIDKNKAREESLDLKTIGKVFFHFGKDDGIPSSVRRTLSVDGKGNYKGGVTRPVLSSLPNASNLATHTSIEGITDGGITLRIGRNHGRNLRRYGLNGFTPTGNQAFETGRIGDVRDADRLQYEAGDLPYQHAAPLLGPGVKKMREIGYGAPGRIGATEEERRTQAGPISNPDYMATSLDAHLVGSAFLRLGDDSDGNSLSFDTKGAIVGWIGAEKRDNRSVVLTMDGGIEANIGRIANSGNSIQAYLQGGVQLRVRGNNKEQDFSVVAEGDQEYRFIGNQDINYEGTIRATASVDMIRTVGSNYSLNVNRHYQSGISGMRVVSIINDSPLPGEKAADQLIIDKGNSEVIIKGDGDMLRQIKKGKIIILNEDGDEELKAYIGKIVLEALRDNVLIQTDLTKVGPPLSLKFPVVTAATGCILTGGFLPHLFGSKHMKVADELPPPPGMGVPIPPIPEI